MSALAANDPNSNLVGLWQKKYHSHPKTALNLVDDPPKTDKEVFSQTS